MREVYFGAILLVIWAASEAANPSPNLKWLLLTLALLFESACWRAAYLNRAPTPPAKEET